MNIEQNDAWGAWGGGVSEVALEFGGWIPSGDAAHHRDPEERVHWQLVFF